jgi:hypothetical protein
MKESFVSTIDIRGHRRIETALWFYMALAVSYKRRA